ncbi:unnamed protein product [Cercospora beticola]|nr:unnamed protein product [Cercospora beticola]
MGNVYEVTKAFIDQNYALWDDQSRRPELKAFYASDSTLSFESAITSFSGGDAIYTGVFNLIPQSTKHEIASVDIQGMTLDDVVVLVTGRVFVGGGPDPLYFSELFQLKTADSGDAGSLYILRDIIRVTKLQ